MPKNTGSGRGNPYQLEELIVKIHRTPAGIAWRWRTELLTIAFTAAVLRWLDAMITLIWAGATLAVLLALVAAVPHTRRFITRRMWCVLARHRLQRLCWEARLHTRSGRLPMVLWIRPTRVGERAWLLCRAGISAEDFQAHTGELRAACYARDARVTRNRKWSHLVTIDIIRRDTLAASSTITSPLARLIAHYQHHPALTFLAPTDDETGSAESKAPRPGSTARIWLCEHCWWAWPLTVPFCGTCGRSRATAGAGREIQLKDQLMTDPALALVPPPDSGDEPAA